MITPFLDALPIIFLICFFPFGILPPISCVGYPGNGLNLNSFIFHRKCICSSYVQGAMQYLSVGSDSKKLLQVILIEVTAKNGRRVYVYKSGLRALALAQLPTREPYDLGNSLTF